MNRRTPTGLQLPYLIAILCLCLGILTRTPGVAQDSPETSSPGSKDAEPISAALHIPPSGTYVLGDDIPLNWQFANSSDEPLAFMWEGCCRLNGKLSVLWRNQEVPPTPPGSSMAHMFARAAVVKPGATQEFDTMLSDWVQLQESGSYRLQGRYMGVMPTQNPQVPKGLSLWKGEAVTKPIALSVLTPPDYLGQRVQRINESGLTMALSGPGDLLPLQDMTFQLAITNTSGAEKSLAWPSSFRLWLINEEGRRVGRHQVKSDPLDIQLASNQSQTFSFTLSTATLLDAPLGRYQLFIDHYQEPRVPSSIHDLNWDLDKEAVLALVDTAAKGPRTAFRNPALKLLRVYLGQITGDLAAIDWKGESAETADLGLELALAGRLKPHAPNPGQVELNIPVASEGNWQFSNELIRESLMTSKRSFGDGLARLLEVRRHLGWALSLRLEPEQRIQLSDLIQPVREMDSELKNLSKKPFLRLTGSGNASTNIVNLTPQPVPANFIFRVRREPSGFVWEAARKLKDPEKPQLPAFISPEAIRGSSFRKLNHPGELRDWLTDGKQPSRQILILADPKLRWEDFLASIRPLLDLGQTMSLTLDDPDL